MQGAKREKIEARGWRVGSADEFLGLAPEESAYIEMKLALGRSLKERRCQSDLSQLALARLIRSSQSRVAKMEAGDPGVSIDLLMKSLLAIGVSPEEVARVISSSASRAS